MKLVRRTVQGSVTATADVKTIFLVVKVLAGAGPLRSFPQNDPFFIRCQLVVLRCHKLLHRLSPFQNPLEADDHATVSDRAVPVAAGF